jgi:hypothetical protein
MHKLFERALASCNRRRLTRLLHRRELGPQWRFTDFSIGNKNLVDVWGIEPQRSPHWLAPLR